VVENIGQFADDDPEYESDAAADDDAEVAALVPTDPKDVPKDEGDAGEVGEAEALGDIG
jgi:hypothetical protein